MKLWSSLLPQFCLLLGCATTQPTHLPKYIPEQAQEVLGAYMRFCKKECRDITFAERPTSTYGAVEFDGKTKALVYVDRDRMGAANLSCGTSFGPSLYAHELGHILSLDFGEADERTPHEWELAADRWAGCLIKIAGLDTHAWSCFFSDIAKEETKSHPSGEKRNKAFLDGAEACSYY